MSMTNDGADALTDELRHAQIIVVGLTAALLHARAALRRIYAKQGLSFEPSDSPLAGEIEEVLKRVGG